MSRKDVELVIRAKDEATKAVNAITAAINSLTASQDDMTKGAGRSDTALARLGQTFSQLDKQLRGVHRSETRSPGLWTAPTRPSNGLAA